MFTGDFFFFFVLIFVFFSAETIILHALCTIQNAFLNDAIKVSLVGDSSIELHDLSF